MIRERKRPIYPRRDRQEELFLIRDAQRPGIKAGTHRGPSWVARRGLPHRRRVV